MPRRKAVGPKLDEEKGKLSETVDGVGEIVVD